MDRRTSGALLIPAAGIGGRWRFVLDRENGQGQFGVRITIGMVITKTPFRVSFFGGGTDYPEYFARNGGAVLATAIDHAAFVSVSHFYSKLFDYNLRIAYRQVECVNSLEEIQHDAF